MSDDANPKTKTEPEPVAEPVAEPTTAEPDLAETQELAPEDRPAETVTPAVADRQVVYVHAPVPPKVGHNRLFGALLALLGTAIYGVLYFGAVAVVILITPGARLEPSIQGFVNSSAFWVPVLFFAIASIVLAIMLNRAAWWTHVVGSLVVAIFVYWASAGLLALLSNIVAMTPDEATAVFWAIAGNPILFIAAILAREVPIWIGLAISSRGRRVRAKNAEAKAAYDVEQAEKKAEYERAATTV